MHIHQLSVTYLPEQDRILMRINTTDGEEMRIWLTRRLMVGLWPLLSRMLTDHLLKLDSAGAAIDTADEELKKMLADFRKEEFLRQADFDTPYKEAQETRLPLGEEPLLVTDVDATPLPAGPLRLAFNERPASGSAPRSFQMEMEPKLMQGLMHLLEQALTQSGWRDPFMAAPVHEEAAADEDASGSRRPRYLN
ncbi:hypothetical protein [Ramlibacter albus]|uniref:Uncharacterized protein n=1 Tax=Ramlibacter albus TaxID=2079448 RepID=A0A923S342_9BURK|nr:hypothetical protein [Ramlibacter albus]MBC5766144.1 hypothetical protein [Ramlibacter albus]